jgi:hypothetical protein
MSARTDCLETSEGELISISIAVEPQNLEALLDTLAEVGFPVNPQIYHDAAVVTRYPDGSEQREATTLVEFPAYAGRFEQVRQAVAARGLDASTIQATGMLEEIQNEALVEPVPAGAAYVSRRRLRRGGSAAARSCAHG